MEGLSPPSPAPWGAEEGAQHSRCQPGAPSAWCGLWGGNLPRAWGAAGRGAAGALAWIWRTLHSGEIQQLAGITFSVVWPHSCAHAAPLQTVLPVRVALWCHSSWQRSPVGGGCLSREPAISIIPTKKIWGTVSDHFNGIWNEGEAL